MRDHLLFYINSERVEVRGHDAFLTVSDFVRNRRRLTGTKVVCAEGDCGACTVLVGRLHGSTLRYEPIDACITFVHQVDLCHVVTVEGLTPDSGIGPVQRAMVDYFGSQCGFCTPGFVVAMTALFESDEDANNDALSEAALRQGLSGNLCRCTGYLQILEAGRSLRRRDVPSISGLYPSSAIAEELRTLSAEPVTVEACDGEYRLFLPTDLQDAVEIKSRHPSATVIAGATDLGVQYNKGTIDPRIVLGLGGILSFGDVSIADGVLLIGAGATWAKIERFAQTRIPELYRILSVFGAPQIRNRATIGGNLANASPIADSLPFLFVMDADIQLIGASGTRRIPIREFYTGYKQTAMREDELIARVMSPLPTQDETLRLYKLSKRKDLDISTLTAGILVRRDGERITRARLAYGGAGPVVLPLPRTEEFLVGREMTEDVMRQAGKLARTEIAPISDVRGSAEFRSQLAENLLLKFFHDSSDAPHQPADNPLDPSGG